MPKITGMTNMIWTKKSGCVGGECVEVSPLIGGGVGVRDSKNPDVHLEFSRDDWDAFLAGAKNGDFDDM